MVDDDQVAKVLKWLDAQPNFRTLQVVYPELIADPRGNAQRIDEFLGGRLAIDAMAAAVDPKLYRNRRSTP